MCSANCSIYDFGEIGANFSVQLSLQTHFAKINNKKLLPKINVKRIKNRVHSGKTYRRLILKVQKLLRFFLLRITFKNILAVLKIHDW